MQVEYELGLPAFEGPAAAEAHAMAVLCCYRDHMHLSGKYMQLLSEFAVLPISPEYYCSQLLLQ